MSKVRIFFGAITIVLIFSISVFAQTTCMFIASTDPMTEGDQIVFDKLVEWGYDVTPVISSDLALFTEDDYADFDFLFASESVGSSTLEPLRPIPKPLLCSEGWASKPGALAWSDPASAGNLSPPESILILDEAEGHPLAAGYSPGDVLDLCSSADAIIVPHMPTIDIIPIGALDSDPTQMLVYGVEMGTETTTGEITANRASMVAVHEWGYPSLTEDAWALYNAGIKWILGSDVSVESKEIVSPTSFSLYQNYPNPFNPITQISYSIAKQSEVTLTVFNLLGEKVATLIDSKHNAGEYSVTFDATGLSSGIYFYQLQTDGQLITKKMLLNR